MSKGCDICKELSQNLPIPWCSGSSEELSLPNSSCPFFFISRDVWTFSKKADFTYGNYRLWQLTFTLHFNSPCPDKTVFDTQLCWHWSSLLCNLSSIRQWIICKKVIHCCLTGGWEHANSTWLQSPHMLNLVTKHGFGPEFMLVLNCSCAMNPPTVTLDLHWCEITITPTGTKRASTQTTAREPLQLYQLKRWDYLNFQCNQISFLSVLTFSCNISFLHSTEEVFMGKI